MERKTKQAYSESKGGREHKTAHIALQHLYLNRLIEGYAPCDSIFTSWKTLYNDWKLIKEQIEIDSFGRRSSLCDDVDPIISSNLKYPSVQRNSKPAQKKLELPKHMTGKEALF